MGQTQSQGMGADRTVNMAAIQEQEIYEILETAICMGAQFRVREETQKVSQMNRIKS